MDGAVKSWKYYRNRLSYQGYAESNQTALSAMDVYTVSRGVTDYHNMYNRKKGHTERRILWKGLTAKETEINDEKTLILNRKVKTETQGGML